MYKLRDLKWYHLVKQVLQIFALLTRECVTWDQLLSVFCYYLGGGGGNYFAIESFACLCKHKSTVPNLMWLRFGKFSVNSVWPSDAIWQQRSGWTLTQVIACCLIHQPITWTKVKFSLVRFSGTNPRAISQPVPKLLFRKIILWKL